MCKWNKTKNLASSHVNSVWAESDRMYEYLFESMFGMSQAIPIVVLWTTDMNSELNQGVPSQETSEI